MFTLNTRKYDMQYLVGVAPCIIPLLPFSLLVKDRYSDSLTNVGILLRRCRLILVLNREQVHEMQVRKIKGPHLLPHSWALLSLVSFYFVRSQNVTAGACAFRIMNFQREL